MKTTAVLLALACCLGYANAGLLNLNGVFFVTGVRNHTHHFLHLS